MKQHPPRAIFGLNFLSTPSEDVKDDESFCQGAYDSEQQVWITQGQVIAAGNQTPNGSPGPTLYYAQVSRGAHGSSPDYGYVHDYGA